MRPCACGVAHDDSVGSCPVTLSESIMSKALLDSSPDLSDRVENVVVNETEAKSDNEAQRPSTLIEFPGATRTVPEWRKQLSQRVREVQERRAREAAEEAAAAQEAGLVSCVLPSAQLELVPDLEQQVLNPIVSK